MVTLSLKYFFDDTVTYDEQLSSIKEMTINNEQHIINQIIAGDTQTFTALMDKYKDLVFTLAVRMLKHREAAEEVSQDVFIKVYKSLHRFKGNSKLSTWIYKITYYTCLDAIKKGRRKHLEIALDEYESLDVKAVDDALEKLQTDERNATIKDSIEALSGEDSFLLTLYYFEELSLDEISKVTNLKPNNIKVKLHRGRKRLAVVLKQRLEPELIEQYGK